MVRTKQGIRHPKGAEVEGGTEEEEQVEGGTEEGTAKVSKIAVGEVGSTTSETEAAPEKEVVDNGDAERGKEGSQPDSTALSGDTPHAEENAAPEALGKRARKAAVPPPAKTEKKTAPKKKEGKKKPTEEKKEEATNTEGKIPNESAEENGGEKKEGGKSEENKEEKKEGGKEEGKRKEKKKTIPTWTTLSDEAKSKLVKSSKKMAVSRAKLEDEVVLAIKTCRDSRGSASANTIRRYLASKFPDTPSFALKKAMKKALEKKLIAQTKGVGMSGSFKVQPAAAKKKTAAKATAEKGSLEDSFPLAFTWACNPKEASVAYIKKYISVHYPELDVEGGLFKKAIEGGEAKGQLKRITGKGFSGTFALVDGANKTGARYEDAIESAIIAMNEPKDCSVNALRDYLGEYHGEFDTDNKPFYLKKALDRSMQKGWIQQITGKGFSGTYRLCWPFQPSPQLLWGDEYEKKAARSDRKPSAKAAAAEDDSEDDISDNEEVMPTPKKRKAPVARSSAAPPAKKSAAKSAKPAAKPAASKASATSKASAAKKTKKAASKKKSRK